MLGGGEGEMLVISKIEFVDVASKPFDVYNIAD